MEQFVWSMEGEQVKDLFRYVLMESGDMCVDMVGILILTMQEWCVVNWDTLQQVLCLFMNNVLIYSFLNIVYSASYNLFSGGSHQPIIYDRISCSSTAQVLSNCNKTVYYYSSCPITYTGGVVCEGNFLALSELPLSVMYSSKQLHFW